MNHDLEIEKQYHPENFEYGDYCPNCGIIWDDHEEDDIDENGECLRPERGDPDLDYFYEQLNNV